jgi:hypothetical protein
MILRQEEEHSLHPLPISAEIGTLTSVNSALKLNLEGLVSECTKTKEVAEGAAVLT